MGNTAVDPSRYDTDGPVEVTWDNSDEAANWHSWRVYRRDLERDLLWTLKHEVFVAAQNYSWEDFYARANEDAEYAVVQVTSDDGGQTTNEGSYTPVAATPTGEHYWFIDSTNPDLDSLRLEHVTSDGFSEEYEEDTLLLIGRGRKKDQGERWGFTGTLSAQLRNRGGLTPKQQVYALQQLKERQGFVWLRNPFGDVYKIGLGDLSYSRVPGVGTTPFIDVSIPYEELG